MGRVRGAAILVCLVAALAAASFSGGATHADILFDGTWEGSDRESVWTNIKQSYGGGSFSFVSDPERRGTVARVTLPPGGEAAIEAIHHRPLGLGKTTVYGLALKFPRDWQVPREDWGLLVAQLAYPLLKYTNIALGVGADYVGLEMHTGFINWQGRKPSADAPASFDFYRSYRTPGGYVIPPDRFATGVWHLIIIEVTWAMDRTGSLRAWHQKPGESGWTKTVEFQRIPTMQWGYGITGAYMSIDGKDAQGELREVSDKIGAYRYEGSNPVAFYNDGLLVGTSAATIAARLQAGPFTPVIRAPRLRRIALGRPYRAVFEANGGVLPIRWSVTRGQLPPGLRLVRRDGAIAGRAKVAGTWPIVLTVRDALGARASRAVTFRVRR